jgi:hypothetical protein
MAGSPLCEPAFSQLISDRKRQSYALSSDSSSADPCPMLVADHAFHCRAGRGGERDWVDAWQSKRNLGGPAKPAIQPTSEFVNDRVGLLAKLVAGSPGRLSVLAFGERGC